MKDKEKQIEEIAKRIHIATDLYYMDCIKVATYLFEKDNCRIIDKDSVVLSKVEKEKLLKEMYEQGKFDAIADLDKDGKVVLSKEEYEILKIKEKEKHWLQTCMSVWENAKIDGSNETAEKILTYIGNMIDDCDDRFKLKDYQWHKNLCKQFGVEIKE